MLKYINKTYILDQSLHKATEILEISIIRENRYKRTLNN